VAGYSGTPLVQKLGIKPGHRVALVNPPDDFAKTLGELPDGVQLDGRMPSAKRAPDAVVWFVSRRKELLRRLPILRARMEQASSLWVCWPKKASGVATDMTEGAIREVALPIGLVDNKVCAVDATWSGLRLVVRLELRRYDEAEKLYQEALDTERRVLGPEHPDTLSSMGDLAVAYMQGARMHEAESLLQETIAQQRRLLGPEHPDLLGSMGNLALVYMQEGRFREASKLLQETVEVERRVLGPDNPTTLQGVFSLAAAYSGENRYDEGQKLAQEAVTGLERQKLTDGADMGGARMALGWALMGQKRHTQAEPELIAAERLLSAAKGLTYKKCLTLLVATYEGWEKAEPGKGHSAQALKWKAKLAEATRG
jgi:Tetratricopeptide repeat